MPLLKERLKQEKLKKKKKEE